MKKVKATIYEVKGPGDWAFVENIELEMVVPEHRVKGAKGRITRIGPVNVCFQHGDRILEIPLADLRRALGDTSRDTPGGSADDRPRIFH